MRLASNSLKSGKKKEPKPELLGPDYLWVMWKGWGPKSSVCPSNPRETKLYGGISQDFCRDIRDIPGAAEKSEKKLYSIVVPDQNTGEAGKLCGHGWVPLHVMGAF